MKHLISLNKVQNDEFSHFLQQTRKKIISNPKTTLENVLEDYDKTSITLENLSAAIKNLRELSYEYFLDEEAVFNGEILKNIALKFEIPSQILQNLSIQFLNSLDKNNFKKQLAFYFGEFSAGISPYIYALCLSNTNSRRSRSGKTFEAVIYFLYSHFNYKFDAQSKIGKKAFLKYGLGKVVDSILPSIDAFNEFRNKTIVGSMKTSLRERWQEVVEETARSNLPNIYLLTCDENISKNKIIQMKEHNIILVVYKNVKENLKEFPSVISFEEYFSKEIPVVMEYWKC
ncbi:type II restriction endonuclease [Campylobacter ureolyticus]|uniref:type II restriction endonuclease n=1 Tax=Campylobacter ureolyticus TaxID=827 RepID=UPI00290BC550|nr:type II restriction endonuclease [Campylobacter ureolyticus]MDU5324975.1 type II restriction endonuclease [Campylobacter ureolyticus]